jgi:hypothetical protein
MTSANLTPASRRQDHTTSPSASGALVEGTIRVHRIPPRVRDDREPPLRWDGMTGDMQVICVFCKSEYFCNRGWTNIGSGVMPDWPVGQISWHATRCHGNRTLSRRPRERGDPSVSATRSSRRRAVHCEPHRFNDFAQPPAPVVMGPSVRRDDARPPPDHCDCFTSAIPGIPLRSSGVVISWFNIRVGTARDGLAHRLSSPRARFHT